MERVKSDEWSALSAQWAGECDKFDENFEEYAQASLPVLKDLALQPAIPFAGVFGVRVGDQYKAVCQANSTLLPGYNGKVLRIRHIVVSPVFDFSDELDLEAYSNVLVQVFVGALEIANGAMPSPHIKFHLRSRAEREFGELFTDALKGREEFGEAEMRGAWIYLSKTHS